MASDDLIIRLRLEMQQYVAEMAKMPNVSDAALKKFQRQHDKTLRKIERDSAKAAKNSRKEWDRNLDKMGGAAERTASLMGGVFGDIADSVLDLGGRVGEISTGLGGATGAVVGMVGGVAALTAAFGFAAHAVDEWLQSNVELRASLENVRGIEPITPSVLAALDDYNEAVRDSEAVTAALALTVQGQLAPAFTDARNAMVGTASAATSVITWLDEVDAGTRLWQGAIDGTRASLPLLSNTLLAAGLAMGVAADHGEELAEAIEHIDEAQQAADLKAFLATWQDFGPTAADMAEGGKRLGEETRRAEEAARALAKAEADAHAEQLRHVQTVKALGAEFDRLYAEEQAGIAEAAAAATAAERERLDFLATLEETKERAREKEEAWNAKQRAEQEQAFRVAMSSYATIGEGVIATLEAEAAQRDKILAQGQAQRQQERGKLDDLLAAGRITEEQHAARIAQIAKEGYQQRKEHRQIEADKERAAKVAFAAIQATRVAEAAMQMPVNAASLVPFYAWAGPAAPGLAWGTAAAAFAGQVASIRAQNAPEFPTGGIVGRAPGMTPDHMAVGAQPGEGILSHQGVAALGGPAGVDAANRGQISGGGGTVVMLDGRVVGAAVESAMRRPSIGREIDRRTGTMPGMRRG